MGSALQLAHLNHLVGILHGMAFAGAFLSSPRRAWWRWLVILLPLVLFASQLNSPWQVEWQLVESQPSLVTSSTDCQLSSTNQDVYTPAVIRFENKSNKPVAMYWLDYEGQAQFPLWICPGGSREYNSFVGYPWCIVDVDRGEALQAATVTEVEQTITIR